MSAGITAYIGLGSNLGNSLRILLDAWQDLGRQPGITAGRLSHPYCTEPVGMPGSGWFVNAVGSIQTGLGPEELLDRLLEVELRFGRIRDQAGPRHQDRTLDLDLLLYGQLVRQSARLVLPHPELTRRAFVLVPLCEIAPELRHPVTNRTMAELLALLTVREPAWAVKKIGWPRPA